MVVDVVMGISALVIASWLGVCSAPLADGLQEGDERYRSRHPWVESFEPQAGFFATADGRWWILRGWLLSAAIGFAIVGDGLILRALL